MAFEIENQQNPLASRKIFGEKTVPQMTATLQKLGIKSERTAFKILIGISVVCFVLAIYFALSSLDSFIEPKTGQIFTNETPIPETK